MILHLLIFSLYAQSSMLTITPDNLKELVETRNQNLEASRLETQSSEMRKGYLSRSFLPSLEIYGSQESFQVGQNVVKNQPEFGAEFKLNLYNGGRDHLESKARDLDSKQKSFESMRYLSEILLKARSLFWNLLYTQEVLKEIRNSIERNQLNLKLALRRIQSGVATQTDRFEFEMKTTDLNQELKELELTYQLQLKELSILLNLKSDEKIALPSQMEHQHDFEVRLTHEESDHDFLFQDLNQLAEATRLRARKEARSYWPRIDAYALYNQFNEREEEFPRSQDRTESAIGLKMTISLSQGLEAERQAASQKLQAQALQQQADYKKREVEIHIENEMSELKLKHDQIHAAEENVVRAEKYYNLTKSEYSRGVKNSPDVLGASDKLFDIKRKHLEIVRDFQVAKSHVLSKMGK